MKTKYNTDIRPFVEELNLDTSKFEEFYSRFSIIEMRNLLIIGLKKGYTHLVQCYVENLNPDVKFDYDVIVNISAKFGFLEIIIYLVSTGKINIIDVTDVILKKSSYHSKYDILNWIIDKNLVSIYDVLIYNSSIGNLNILQYYLSEKNNTVIDIHYKNELILRTAGYNDKLDVIKYLYNDQGCDIRALDDSIFRYGSESGFYNIVKYSIESGSDVHSCNDEAIRRSCVGGHLDIVKYLINLGANIHVNSNEPISKACMFGHLDIVKFLVESGANINANNSEPLKICLKHKYLEIFNYLIEIGVDIYKNYSNLLLTSIENNIVQVTNLLLSNNHIHLELDNSACLIRACEKNKLDLVKILLNPNTCIDYLDGKPLTLAIEKGYLDIVEFLLSAGANPNLITNSIISQTINKYPKIIKLLFDFNFNIENLSSKIIKKIIDSKILDSYGDNKKILLLDLMDKQKIKYHNPDKLDFDNPDELDSENYNELDSENYDEKLNANEPNLDNFDFDELTINLE